MKTFVLDTNVLLHDAHSIYKLGANEIVIPAVVLEEVDSKKRLQDEVGRNARMISRILKDLRRENPGQLSKGIPLHTGGTIRVELNHISFEHVKEIFTEITNDNRILAVTMNLQKESPEKEVILISNDGLLASKADALGIQAEEYESGRLVDDSESIHKGYHEIEVEPAIIDKFYAEKGLDFEELRPHLKSEAYVQDFFIIKSLWGGSKSALARLVKQQNKLKLIKLSYDGKSPVWDIMPKNVQQHMLMEMLLDDDVQMICVTGKAGTGKTLLALAASLLKVYDEKKYKKMLVARPVVPMGKDIGFLPGEKDEKLRPWMQPIYDNLEFLFNTKKEDELEKILAGLKTPIQVEALTYIRGRSIPHQIMIIDEAQNLSPMEIKTIATRMGDDSKLIICGDPDQIDHPYLDNVNNGLVYAIERMKQEEEVGIIQLEKTERSSLAEKAAKLL